MRKIVIIAAAAMMAAGCAAGRVAHAPAEPSSALDYDILWRASVDVIGERFPIAAAQKDAGTITTDWLIGALSKTGIRSNDASARAAAEDMLHTMRRRASVTIDVSGFAPPEVRVDVERLVREHPYAIRSGTFSVGSRIEGDEAPYPTRWVDAGRDQALERRIASEIQARCRSRRR